ncbi:hypothetical protein L1887_36740 [Cichorium endivia]|nr:hypothetical protein L1887_36740 [Cichorium endivia]
MSLVVKWNETKSHPFLGYVKSHTLKHVFLNTTKFSKLHLRKPQRLSPLLYTNREHASTIVAAFQPHLLRRVEQSFSGDYSGVPLSSGDCCAVQLHRSIVLYMISASVHDFCIPISDFLFFSSCLLGAYMYG